MLFFLFFLYFQFLDLLFVVTLKLRMVYYLDTFLKLFYDIFRRKFNNMHA